MLFVMVVLVSAAACSSTAAPTEPTGSADGGDAGPSIVRTPVDPTQCSFQVTGKRSDSCYWEIERPCGVDPDAGDPDGGLGPNGSCAECYRHPPAGVTSVGDVYCTREKTNGGAGLRLTCLAC